MKLPSMMIRHLFLATKYRDTVYIYIQLEETREKPQIRKAPASNEEEREREREKRTKSGGKEEKGEGGLCTLLADGLG